MNGGWDREMGVGEITGRDEEKDGRKVWKRVMKEMHGEK